VSLQNRFSRSRGLTEEFDQLGPVLEEGEVFVDREATLRNDATASISRMLSPRTTLGLTLNQRFWDFERPERADALSFRGSAHVRRSLTRRQGAGFGFAASRYQTQETDFQQERGTDIFEAFAIYDFVISRTMRFAVSAGPAWVMSDDVNEDPLALQYRSFAVSGQHSVLLEPSGAPAQAVLVATGAPAGSIAVRTSGIPRVPLPFVGGPPEIDATVNLFGNVSLTYSRRPFSWSIGYTRRANNTSGTGTTNNLDVASISGGWEPERRWRLGARATWQRQTSISEFPVIEGFDTSATGVSVLLDGAGVPVSDPALAVYEVQNVAENVAIRADLDDSAFEVTSYNFNVNASYRISPRLHAEAVGGYWFQTSEGDFAEETDRQSFRFALGLTWSFDPFPL
jgi:hypothetical protein